MSETEILKFIRELGFPAAVAFFVLWRLDRTLHEILVELSKLRDEVRRSPAERPAA